MLLVDDLPSLIAHVVPGEPDDHPIEITAGMARILMQRATSDIDLLMEILAQQHPTPPPTQDNPFATPDSPPDSSPLSIELTWDIDETQVPQQTQTVVMALVGAAIVMAIKDMIAETANTTGT